MQIPINTIYSFENDDASVTDYYEVMQPKPEKDTESWEEEDLLLNDDEEDEESY